MIDMESILLVCAQSPAHTLGISAGELLNGDLFKWILSSSDPVSKVFVCDHPGWTFVKGLRRVRLSREEG